MGVGSAYADTPKSVILGHSQVPNRGTIALDATKSISDKPFSWEFAGPDSIRIPQPGDVTRNGKPDRDNNAYIVVYDAAPGTYTFTLKTIGWPPGKTAAEDIDSDKTTFIVTVDQPPAPVPTPNPTPIPPPTPIPNPTDPVVPTPTPNPTPQVDTGKLRVILLRETSQVIPKAQQYAIDSPSVAKYLNSKTMVDGAVHAWRRYDPDAITLGETPTWQVAMTNARNDPRFKSVSNPKVIIFNGETPVDFLPITDENALLATLKSYGGP
jgi:hypothetical protein